MPKYYYILLGLIIQACLGGLFAQGPMINAGPDVTICLPGSTTLTATVTDIRQPSVYTQSIIPYAPGSFTQGSSVSLSDDTQSPMQNIGFPFCYFGIPYNQFIIGSNNWVGFVAAQTSTWVTVPIPSNTGNAPRGTIMGPWQDINPGIGGTIRWYTDGVAPFRRLVVAYQNVPMFSCTGQLYTSQIIIYETTNNVETHINNKPICNTWNSGNAVHGLHHPNGMVADVVAGRNNTQWTTNNEGRRWTPAGPPAYTVTWFSLPGNTPVGTGLTVNVSPQVTTSYRAVVTYNCTNVSFDDTVLVNAALVPPPPLNGTLNVCPNGTGTYTTNAVPGATYNWVSTNGNITGGQGTTSATVQWGSVNGTIRVFVGSGGCAAVDSLIVNIYPPTQLNIFGNNSPYCLNSLPVQLTPAPAGGTFSGPGMTGSTFTPATATAGTHTITYTHIDINSCTNSTTIPIAVLPLIANNTYGSSQTICSGTAPVTLTGAVPGGGSGLFQYQWERSTDNITWTPIGGANAQDYSPGTLNTTTFFRRQVLSGACNDIGAVITIQVLNPVINNTITASQSICDGQTPAQLTGSNPQGGTGVFLLGWEESTDLITWQAASGTNTATNYTAPALFVNTYYRRIVSSGVCPQVTSAEVSILVNPIPNVITTDATICLGQTAGITASGSIPGGSYLWSPGGATQGTIQVSPLQTSTYTVNYTLNGCISPQGQSVVIVNIPPQGIITPLGSVDLCPGGSVVLSGPVASSYTWTHDPTLNTQNVTISATGTYGLTVIDINGCIVQAPPITVTMHANPVVSTASMVADCFGTATGSLTSTVQAGTAPFSYNWMPGGYTTPDVYQVVAGGYTLTVTDFYGCTGSSSTEVLQPSVLTGIAFLERNVNCFGGSDGAASAQAMGGNGGYQFTWSNGQSGASISGLQAGVYSVTIRDAKGCTDIQQVTVLQPTPVQVSFLMTPVRCFGEQNGALTAVPTGGTGPYFYNWNTDPAQTTPTAVQLPRGQYGVSVTDMNGCEASGSNMVTEPDMFLVSAEADEPKCFKANDGELRALVTGGNGGNAYRWDTQPVQNTATATNVPAGWYKVTAWDMKGCVDTAWVKVGQPDPIPNPTVFGDTLCFQTEATVSVANHPGTMTHWYRTANEALPFYTGASYQSPPLNGTTFWFVEYEDSKGCRSVRLPIGAVVMNPPQANFSADRLVAEVPDAVFNFMVTTHSPRIADWHWDFGDGNTGSGIAPVHQYQNEGFYTVTLTITDSVGCQNVVSKQRLVEVKRYVNVIVPNAFSPNGDGINDFFNIQYRLLETFYIKIFDRWGNQVYASSDMHFRWDGTRDGVPSPEGVYMYIITGTTTDDTPVETGGSFTLIR